MAAVPAATASAGSPGAAALALLAVATLSPLAAALAGDALLSRFAFGSTAAKAAAAKVLALAREHDGREGDDLRAKAAAGGLKAKERLTQLRQDLAAARLAARGGSLGQALPGVFGFAMFFALSWSLSGLAVARLPAAAPEFLASWFGATSAAGDRHAAGYFPLYVASNAATRFLVSKLLPDLSGAPPPVPGTQTPFEALFASLFRPGRGREAD